MKYDEEEGLFSLSSGRTFKPGANLAIGLSVYDGEYELSVGYDSKLYLDDYDEPGPTPAEQIEIAEYMIAKWSEYLATLREKHRSKV